MNRIEKIRAKRMQLDKQAEEERIEREDTILTYEQLIEALAPRICEMVDVAIELVRNRIPLGKLEKTPCGFLHPGFVAEGIYHKLGFNGGNVTLIGIEGGGCCGNDIFVNKDGKIVVNPLDKVIGLWTYEKAYNDFRRKCKRFLSEFDDFEKRFYEYVDNL